MDINKPLSLVPNLIEIVSSAIKQVEAPGNGVAKADAVIALVRASLEQLLPGNSTAEQIEMIIDYVRSIIPVLVSIFNITGLFSKKSTAPITATPAPIPTEPLINERQKLTDQIAVLKEQEKTATGDALAAINKKIRTKTERLAALK